MQLLSAEEIYGGLGKSVRKLIKQIVNAAEDQQQLLSSEEIRKELTGSVAIAVQKGNAKILLAEYYRAVSGAARYGKGLTAFTASADMELCPATMA